MEPMALGSPTNPSSSYHGGVNPALNQSQQHLQHGQQQGGAQYLPGYLMGDVSIQVLTFIHYTSSFLLFNQFNHFRVVDGPSKLAP